MIPVRMSTLSGLAGGCGRVGQPFEHSVLQHFKYRNYGEVILYETYEGTPYVAKYRLTLRAKQIGRTCFFPYGA